MTDMTSDIHKGRYQGIAFALTEVARLHDEPQFVADMMSNTGLLLTDLVEAGAIEEDLDEIRKCYEAAHVNALDRMTGVLLIASGCREQSGRTEE